LNEQIYQQVSLGEISQLFQGGHFVRKSVCLQSKGGLQIEFFAYLDFLLKTLSDCDRPRDLF
jgi:hypothetical protein